MTSWIAATSAVSIYAGKGDTNEIVYSVPYYTGFLTRHDAANATQGEWFNCHEIFASSPPAIKLFRHHASWYQDYSEITSSRFFDSTRTWLGGYTGAVEYVVNRFNVMFSLFRIIDKLPADMQDWSGYDYVYFDVKSTDAAVELWAMVQASDRPANRALYFITPGQYFTVRFPLKDLAWVSNIDLTDVKDFRIYVRNVHGATNVFIDNIRLVTTDVAPILPLLTEANSIKEPWLLTSVYKPPVTPPPAYTVPVHQTGKLAVSAPLPIAKNRGDARDFNYQQGVIPFDNVKYGFVGRAMCYVPWGTPPTPNASAGGGYTERCWIGSVDSGKSWRSDNTAGTWPLAFYYQPDRGSLNSFAFSDNMLRGTGYINYMGWCGDYAPGSGFSMYQYFFRVSQNGSGWQVYPEQTHTTKPQYPNVVVYNDVLRGCFGATRSTVLPSGRILTAMISNHLNPDAGPYSLNASYSDDGGNRWQYGPGNRAAVYANGNNTNGISVSAPQYLVPYQGKALCVLRESNVFNYIVGNGESWTSVVKLKTLDYDRGVSSAVCYKDSTVFMGIQSGSSGEMSFLKFHNGVAGTWQKLKTSAAMSSRLTLCGERLWYLWVDTTANAIYCKKYFINQDRWTDDIKLVQATGKIVRFELATVCPPSHVPVVVQELSTTSDTILIQLHKIPIDSEEEALDPDYDGLENSSEAAAGTDSLDPDSDNDGLWDGQEVVLLGTNPKNQDTDGDGDNDALEFYNYTNPKDAARTVTLNGAPAATLTFQTSGNNLMLDGSGTTDPDGDGLRYSWEIRTATGDIRYAEGPRLIVPADIQGARMTVSDGRGQEASAGYGTLVVEKTARSGPSLFLQSAPNPFNGRAVIRYQTASQGEVRLSIYNLQGRLIKKLFQGPQAAGEHKMTIGSWTISTPGVYLVRLESGKQAVTRKLVLVR
ncbi:MAG: T9SS type A sorting domain-containing protein [Fibrobacterota bacterium]